MKIGALYSLGQVYNSSRAKRSELLTYFEQALSICE